MLIVFVCIYTSLAWPLRLMCRYTKKCADLPYLTQACDSLYSTMEKSTHGDA